MCLVYQTLEIRKKLLRIKINKQEIVKLLIWKKEMLTEMEYQEQLKTTIEHYMILGKCLHQNKKEQVQC